MQRVVAGALRGRKLMTVPEGVPGLRPTAAKVREAIFGRLGDEVVEARVLDLFAGSGALSIEALSRGAIAATLFETDARVVKHLLAQLEQLSLRARTEVRRGDAVALLGRAPGAARYDLVFVDPPFATPQVFAPILVALIEHGWLAERALVVCERERVRGAAPSLVLPEQLELEASKVYGQVVVEYLRL
ncbi:MAG: 16S rRNA (guanine(966)-N(2))-methyltransferase RsmD, partial [Deltaproteobacteria bacterium]|nr:16S rRNA (guanine(966)-N(2))-methyltransferase RsmD [Nannocystaceae bacterium]